MFREQRRSFLNDRLSLNSIARRSMPEVSVHLTLPDSCMAVIQDHCNVSLQTLLVALHSLEDYFSSLSDGVLSIEEDTAKLLLDVLTYTIAKMAINCLAAILGVFCSISCRLPHYFLGKYEYHWTILSLLETLYTVALQEDTAEGFAMSTAEFVTSGIPTISKCILILGNTVFDSSSLAQELADRGMLSLLIKWMQVTNSNHSLPLTCRAVLPSTLVADIYWCASCFLRHTFEQDSSDTEPAAAFGKAFDEDQFLYHISIDLGRADVPQIVMYSTWCLFFLTSSQQTKDTIMESSLMDAVIQSSGSGDHNIALVAIKLLNRLIVMPQERLDSLSRALLIGGRMEKLAKSLQRALEQYSHAYSKDRASDTCVLREALLVIRNLFAGHFWPGILPARSLRLLLKVLSSTNRWIVCECLHAVGNIVNICDSLMLLSFLRADIWSILVAILAKECSTEAGHVKCGTTGDTLKDGEHSNDIIVMCLEISRILATEIMGDSLVALAGEEIQSYREALGNGEMLGILDSIQSEGNEPEVTAAQIVADLLAACSSN